nr:protein kinase [Paramuribaculum sp.]
VMDYIDGMTLAEMIKRHDPWLTDERHIVKILRELVNVVDYLHRHNVVHCDIKPDNIMLTANGKNLVLVDFDKSYTDALNDTSGHPYKYGLPSEAKGRFAIDFRGMGMVVEKLKANVPDFKFSRYRQFVKACYNQDVDCEILSSLLDYTPSSRFRTKAIDVSVIVAAVILVVTYLIKPADIEPEMGVIIKPDSVEVPGDSVAGTVDVSTRQEAIIQPPVTAPKQTSSGSSEADESESIEERFAILCYEVQPYFDELITALNNLDILKSDTTLSRHELLEHWNRYSDLSHKNIGVVMDKTRHIFYDVSVEELGNYMSATPSYKQYISRSKEVTDAYNREIDRRRKQ